MRYRDTLKTSVGALTKHKSRSLLTVLGVIIGITSIVMVMALGAGTEGLIVGELGGLGAETLVIRPGLEPDGPIGFAETLFADSLKDREYEALMNRGNVPDLRDASPEVFVGGSASYGSETYQRSTILGIRAEFMADVLGLRLAEGVLFDESDIRSNASVAIIGQAVKEELFGDEPAIGESITIKGRKFRVSGIYAPKGQIVFFNVDDIVVIPYTTANTYLTGKNHYMQILAQASSPKQVDRMKNDIELTLRELHNIGPDDKDDFYVQTQQGLVDQVQSILGAFVAFLSLVVAVALVVGGVGVMNVMLVSVTERTKEIGLRKSIGATNRDVLKQFLVEAIILTSLGGIVGIALGTVLAYGASLAILFTAGYDLGFSFPVMGAVLGLGVSMLTGIIFGIYPAYEASKKSPIEALTYE